MAYSDNYYLCFRAGLKTQFKTWIQNNTNVNLQTLKTNIDRVGFWFYTGVVWQRWIMLEIPKTMITQQKALQLKTLLEQNNTQGKYHGKAFSSYAQFIALREVFWKAVERYNIENGYQDEEIGILFDANFETIDRT